MKGFRATLATRAAIIYVLIGGVWILVSDLAVEAVFKDPASTDLYSNIQRLVLCNNNRPVSVFLYLPGKQEA